MAKVNVLFQVGKTDPKAAAHQFSAALAEAMVDDAGEAVRNGRIINFQKFAKDLTARIRASYISGINYAIKNMIGQASTIGSKTYKTFSAGSMSNYGTRDSIAAEAPPRGSIQWRALAYDTMKRKKKAGQPERAFFIGEGKLKTYLRRNAKRIADGTGIVKIDRPQTVARNAASVRPRDTRGRFLPETINLATVGITVMPRVPASMLPGLKSNNIGKVDPDMRFEKMLINNKEIIDKLYGPAPDRQRHLLQPIFTFWTNYYIPNQITRALREAV